MEPEGFKLVMQNLDPLRRGRARDELARLFKIDADIAQDILGAAPIILLRDLTLDAARIIRGRLRPIAEAGARLVLTDAPCDEIPKVNWPEPPEVAEVSDAEARGQAPLYEEVAGFRCPTCGEALLLVRAGRSRRSLGTAPSAPTFGSSAAPIHAPALEPRAPIPTHTHAHAHPQAPAPRPAPAPAPEPKPPAPRPSGHVDQGPLVRALHEERERRESQRLEPVGAGSGTVDLAYEETDAFDRMLMDEQSWSSRPATARPVAPAPAPRPAPAPTEEEPERAELSFELDSDDGLEEVAAATASDADAFDIDEALRLLDNAPSSPAPQGARPAPAPAPAAPREPLRVHVPEAEVDEVIATAGSDAPGSVPDLDPIDFGEDESGLFGDVDDDLGDLERALAQASPSAPRSQGRAARGETPLKPLDADEALAILSSSQAGSSSEDLLLDPQPSSDELQPLDPNEALEILSSQSARVPISLPERPDDDPKRRARRGDDEPDGRSDERKDRSPRKKPTRAVGKRKSERLEASRSKKRGSDRKSPGKADEPGSDEPVHGLVLSKIAGDKKRQKAAEIISDLTSVSYDEALKLTDRTIIPVLKGVSRTDAEAALNRFQRSKISGRVTTRRLGRS